MPIDPKKKADRRESIIVAALNSFSRYGYRRTSMDEIAREAGISRAALYLHFENKETLFRAQCQKIHDDLVVTAELAAGRPGSLEKRLIGVFDAKISEFFELLARTQHGDELLDQNSRLCGDISTTGHNRFHAVVLRVLNEAQESGEIALEKSGLSASRAADLVHSAVAGIEFYSGDVLTPARFRRELVQMIKVLVAGLGGR